VNLSLGTIFLPLQRSRAVSTALPRASPGHSYVLKEAVSKLACVFNVQGIKVSAFHFCVVLVSS
jgi:hypothetical protein